MNRGRLLRYVLPGVLVGILVSALGNVLLPVILNFRILFGALVVLLLLCGLATAVIAVRRTLR